MKTRNKLLGLIATAIIAIGIVACNNGDNDNNKPETFAVTFNANGGTPQPPAQTIAKGGKVDEPTITKANNTLDGWYTESAFTKKWIFATDTVTAEITLHAKWLCNCNPKDHLGIDETCDCGGANCTCTLKVYGTVAGIKIYRSGSISNEIMTTAVATINTEYGTLAEGEKNNLSGKLDDVYVLPSTTGVFQYRNINGRKVLELDLEAVEWDVGDLLQRISTGALTITQE